MKKTLLSLGIIFFAAITSSAQIIIDTVALGAGYANQKWYSLKNDEVGAQSKDNWDIGFELTGYTASILGNVQKANFAVYKAPYSIANYATIDTAGINTWKLVYNSDTTWTVGAFNVGAIVSNANDLGWGVYNSSTHIITGDSTYVVKLSNTSFKKLKLVDLNGGIYAFEYANIDGTNPQVKTITKATYPGKNFIYYDMTANAVVDREPASANWDLTFVKYMSYAPTIYAVTGVLSNKGVTVAQVDNVTSPATYNTFSSHTFTTTINAIGHDWKAFTGATYIVPNDTVYFVKDKVGDIWKLRFTKFAGSSTGECIFSKEKLASVGIDDVQGNKVASVIMFPNPASSIANLLFSTETETAVNVTITDVTGKLISTEQIDVATGLNQYQLNVNNLSNGVYFVTINSGNFAITQKLIKQ